MTSPANTTGAARGGFQPSVLELQVALRALGYLGSGIDGVFGDGTARAVRALKIDLNENDGGSRGRDGRSPVAVRDYAEGHGFVVDGSIDDRLARIITTMMADPAFPKIPSAENPAAENARAIAMLQGIAGVGVPMPILLAMMQQESGRRHFNMPAPGGRDTFLVMGLDRNDTAHPDRITSRGYGIGQYTLFHHPATQAEIASLVGDPATNISSAIEEFRVKFNRFVVGPDDTADDRIAENPRLRLRLCRYTSSDLRYMTDCGACARAARKVAIEPGVPLYPGSSQTYRPTAYYSSAHYGRIPDRSDFGCDWPYAARRYNGSGINSFHYQVRILRNLLVDA